ncbi:MAG: hypothetical protein R8K46_04920 [Mariprofundaceae bacterium]
MSSIVWSVCIAMVAGFCLIVSWAMGGIVRQPDWAYALLLAALLARRRNWPWILPCVLVHDAMLYWTVLGCLPVMAVLPYFIGKIDQQLGAGVPQRLVVLGIGVTPLLWLSHDVGQWLLTALLIVPLWFMLVRGYGSLT